MSGSNKSGRQKVLAEVAKETKAALPAVLDQIPHLSVSDSKLYRLHQLALLEQQKCPQYSIQMQKHTLPGFITHVLNMDTLDCAVQLTMLPTSQGSVLPQRNVCVLNLASERTPGGGWLGGSLAQEECICYRSSLYLSLKRQYYPIPPTGAIYSPSVVLIRSAYGSGHKILVPEIPPSELPVVSVISIAAIRRPVTSKAQNILDGVIAQRAVFAKSDDRDLTKDKMRLALRIAAREGHTRLVLGALGCGAFRNPTEEVAVCWREVLDEPEFSGGWFEKVVFAVLDKGSDLKNADQDKKGNFAPFEAVLGGYAFVSGEVPRKLSNDDYERLPFDGEERDVILSAEEETAR